MTFKSANLQFLKSSFLTLQSKDNGNLMIHMRTNSEKMLKVLFFTIKLLHFFKSKKLRMYSKNICNHLMSEPGYCRQCLLALSGGTLCTVQSTHTVCLERRLQSSWARQHGHTQAETHWIYRTFACELNFSYWAFWHCCQVFPDPPFM